MHFVFAHRGHAQRRDAMKQLFTRLQVIDVRRRRADHALVDIRRIVHQAAQPGMRLELGTVRQVNGGPKCRRRPSDRRSPAPPDPCARRAAHPPASATPARSASAPDRRASRTWCGYPTEPAPDRSSTTEDWPGPAGLVAAGSPPRPSVAGGRAERLLLTQLVRPTGFRCARTRHRNSNARAGRQG